jgi:hypothetical protein
MTRFSGRSLVYPFLPDVPARDGNWAGITRIYVSRIHTREVKPNPYPYPFKLVGMDLYPYLYPPGIRYPMDIRYPPAH